jgi:hypothetical protein
MFSVIAPVLTRALILDLQFMQIKGDNPDVLLLTEGTSIILLTLKYAC